jgi:thioredoxin reductase (NADPH)
VPHTNLTVYGAPWCGDCKRAKKFLGEQRVHYHWVDVEQDAEGLALVERANKGKRIIPTIVFDDGGILVEPSNAELAAKLGLQTRARLSYYDLIVIGSGPAGLTTALYAAREGLDVLVIEKSGLGGQAGVTERLDNFPGFPDGIGGAEFADRLTLQARRFGVEISRVLSGNTRLFLFGSARWRWLLPTRTEKKRDIIDGMRFADQGGDQDRQVRIVNQQHGRRDAEGGGNLC